MSYEPRSSAHGDILEKTIDGFSPRRRDDRRLKGADQQTATPGILRANQAHPEPRGLHSKSCFKRMAGGPGRKPGNYQQEFPPLPGSRAIVPIGDRRRSQLERSATAAQRLLRTAHDLDYHLVRNDFYLQAIALADRRDPHRGTHARGQFRGPRRGNTRARRRRRLRPVHPHDPLVTRIVEALAESRNSIRRAESRRARGDTAAS